MVCAFFSCSDNDEPVNLTITPVVPDATLSLAVQTDNRVKTKGGFIADGTGDITWDYKVNTLTAVVFNNGAYGDILGKGHIADVFTSKYNIATKTPTLEVEVHSGGIMLLLIANLDVDGQIVKDLRASAASSDASKHLSYQDVLALTTSLSDEGDVKGLTMSSELLTGLNIVPGVNYIGFDNKGANKPYNDGTEIWGQGPVDLVRTVSAITLEKIDLPTVSGEIYQSVKFEPKEVFVANVKSTAGIGASSTDNITIEQTAKDGVYYLAPAEYFKETGSLKYGISSEAPAGTVLLEKLSEVTLEVGNAFEPKLSPCYVYPNQRGEADFAKTEDITDPRNYTLLVVKGDYTYRLIDDPTNTPVTEENRYYTVIVNDKRFGEMDYSGSTEHEHIKRNTKYNIKLSIQGSGSDKPFTPAAFAHVAAKIEVADWNVINIEQPVD